MKLLHVFQKMAPKFKLSALATETSSLFLGLQTKILSVRCSLIRLYLIILNLSAYLIENLTSLTSFVTLS